MPNDLVQWWKLQLPKTVERKQLNKEEKIAESLSAKNVIEALHFSNFSCGFLNPNFSNLISNCFIVLDLRNFHEQVKKVICLKNCTHHSMFK